MKKIKTIRKNKLSTPDFPVSGSLILLGNQIRQERKARRLNQTELASLAKVGINFVGQIEAGKMTAHIGKIIQVLKALGLELQLKRGTKGLSTSTEPSKVGLL